MKNTYVLGFIAGAFLFSLSLSFFVPMVFSVEKQFLPSLSITEEYTDNFNRTKNNKDDEFSTKYKPGFSFGLMEKENSLFFEYYPQYTDYNDKNQYDAWGHSASLEAFYKAAKNTGLSFSDTFNRGYGRTVRTNSLEQHDTNSTIAALQHQFGKNDFFKLSYAYSFDNYENPSRDEFDSHRPSAYLMYWFSPLYGFDVNTSYSKTNYKISSDDPETLRGDFRLIRKVNPHFDAYVKYAQTHTDQNSGNHTVYNPSVGFSWNPTDDSGITLGGGVLFQDYENRTNYDKEKFFLDFDLYKIFEVSKRSMISITGSSSYNDIDETASSLGFVTKYQAGILHTYDLTKQLSSELRGSYRISSYDDPRINREDKIMSLGAGLNWSLLRWMSLNVSYRFSDFTSSDLIREDYQEHTAFVSINLKPSTPFKMKSSSSRSILEDKIFND